MLPYTLQSTIKHHKKTSSVGRFLPRTFLNHQQIQTETCMQQLHRNEVMLRLEFKGNLKQVFSST